MAQSKPEKMNSFTKGMVKDLNDTYIPEGVWTHARNLVNNSHDGQTGTVGNEPSNLHCVTLPYTLIGCIPIEDNEWVLFTTNNIASEIGLFNEGTCTYTTIVNSTCLKFNTNNLITGVSRRTFDCSKKVYWADGKNPDRVLDINKVPWVKECNTVDSCTTCTNTSILDCEQLRLAPLLTVPCLSLKKSDGSGNLLNGTYFVAVAYMVNEIRVTDYLQVSNAISIFSHLSVAGALDLTITNTDPDFDELEVVIISNINGQSVAKSLGVYSTRQTSIYIGNIDPTLVTISLSEIPIITPAIEKSDGIYNVSNYLLRLGVYTGADFNYQPLANLIQTNWVSVKYPADYYHKAGPNIGYMRDEVYSFFIRWVYNTGNRSASYHIPGRPYVAADAGWQTINTAQGWNTSQTLPDGGVVVQEGIMGYWESTEKYPDNNPTVWDSYPLSSGNPYNLCGKNIRHHKFPDNYLSPHYQNGGDSINVLGVKFGNIQAPKDINGNVITSIVGYEILRGSREGQKSVIAKGMVNNMKQYDILEADNFNISKGVALMQNFPYNDITMTDVNDPFYEQEVNTTTKRDYISFHSPDTTFQQPFIGTSYLRTYGDLIGSVVNPRFDLPYRHPKFKILGKASINLVNIISLIQNVLNLAGAVLDPKAINISATNDFPYPVTLGVNLTMPNSTIGTVFYVAGLLANTVIQALWVTFIGVKLEAQKLANLVEAIIPKEQYAKQYNSYGYYNNWSSTDQQSITIKDYGYIKDNVQSLGGVTINNLYRNIYVGINLDSNLNDPSVVDNSLTILGGAEDTSNKQIASKYAAIKVDFPSQYGQIESIKQLPITSCVQLLNQTPQIMFGGDVYINRYTEKNQYTFFNDWLIDQPDEIEYNYRQHQNIVGTKYWLDSKKFLQGTSDLLSVFLCNKDTYKLNQNGTSIGGDCGNSNGGDGFRVKPGYFYLFCNGVRDFFVESEVNVGYRDWDDDLGRRFYDPYGFTDINSMFRTDVIKTPPFYKYDYSLSAPKMFTQFINWGSVLQRSFNPYLAESCYAYYPRRIQYSLPQQEELKKDNWQSFLVNNYKDMVGHPIAVKPINRNGALIMMKDKSPVQLMGVDSLQTDTGVKVTIGDGGLFNQPLQSLVNSDESFQYGSCQNKWSVLSTPQGVFYVSQDQGKVFLYAGGLNEISREGMKWWFSRYLPSNLKKYFPNFDLDDNPVVGAGVLCSYDNTNEIFYITKKDYIPKRDDITYSPGNGFYVPIENGEPIEIPPFLTFGPEGYEERFLTPPINPPKFIKVNLCDPAYFEEVSWTISYDIKGKSWLSFHDWHPSFSIASRTHFLTADKPCHISQTSLYRHNARWDDFCNFYGTYYPFEIEFPVVTGTETVTLKNVEYYLEAYKYSPNGQTKFHVLDYNFNEAIVYNSEQISGLLNLTLKNKSNPFTYLNYPIINPTGSTDILFSKEEQKYRFNQFNDITKDRGEFSGLQIPLINYSLDGYTWQVNAFGVDYYKTPTQRKKFRHNINKVLLRKTPTIDPQGIYVDNDIKMIFKFIKTNLQLSNR